MTDHDQPVTDQPTTPPLLPIEEAAAVLGVTVNAVRQRIKRGTVVGVKTDQGWMVDVSHRPTTDQPGMSVGQRPTNHATTATDHQPTIDLAPLTELIDDLTRRNADLAAAAAMWQTRAAHLENELKQLTAGESQPDPAPAAPESPQDVDTAPTGTRTWWRRLLGL